MIVADFRIIPIGEGTSLHEPMAQMKQVLDEAGIRYEIGPLSTTLEAESMQDVFNAVSACHAKMRGNAGRIITEVAIDDRLDAEETIESLRQA